MGASSGHQDADELSGDARLALDLYWVSRRGNHHRAGSLASRGAELNVRHPDSGEAALHAAAAHGHFKVVRELLDHKADPNIRSGLPGGNTPLHCALRAVQSKYARSRALECVRILLLHPEIKVNRRDLMGRSTVHKAAQLGLWDFAELLIASGADLDIEVGGQTARQIIQHNRPDLLTQANNSRSSSKSAKSELFDALRCGEQDIFIARLSAETSISGTIMQLFLQIACVNGYNKVVKFLLERGADPNSSVNNSQVAPLILAAKQGYHEILRALLDASTNFVEQAVDHPFWQRTALHHAAIAAEEVAPTIGPVGPRSFTTCVTLLLERAKLDLNAVDFLGNTALHYAARSGRRDITRLLLSHQPALFVQNHEGTPAFLHVHEQDLRTCLDKLISIKSSSRHEKFPTLVLDFRLFETPRVKQDVIIKSGYQSVCELQDPPAQLEMEPLLLLSRSPVHRGLLRHPVVRSFLHLKWQHVKLFFYLNFLLYFLFSVSLSFHVHLLVSSPPQDYDTVYAWGASTTENTVRWIAAVFLLWPFCRELLEMFMSMRRYIRNFENWMETSLVALSIVLIFFQTSYYSTQVMSAVVILLTYTDLVFLIGRHPRFATYITMFTTVSRNFLGFFFLFSFLIFAFAFSFYIMFHNCLTEETCETRFFSNLGSSLFKTIVMLTGELEAETLQLDTFGFMLFTGFVLFMAICLLNLLTGLAVSDITAIRDEAQVDSCRAKVKLYAKIESILLGQSIEGLSAEHWLGRRLRRIAEKSFAAHVRLLGGALPECRREVLLTADQRASATCTSTWRARLAPCLQDNGVHGEWEAIVAEAHLTALSSSDLHVKGLAERLENIESKLSELMEIMLKQTNNS